MQSPLAAAIAFFALGATFLGAVVLLLFNPRSATVRWWTLFQVGLMTWLGSQGWGFASGSMEAVWPVLSGAVHMLPAFFLGFAMSDTTRRPLRNGLLAVGVGAALLVVDHASLQRSFAEPLLLAWSTLPWAVATWILWSSGMKSARQKGKERFPRVGVVVSVLLLSIFPVSLIGQVVLDIPMHVFVMPLMIVGMQILIFVGVLYLRFYDIEVRAARTGELAASAAEHERLAVVGELAASLAHEIRNPLTGVRSLAQRIADGEVGEERRRRYAEVILEEVGRVERLVANLLGIARRPRPRAVGAAGEVTALAPLLEDLLLLLGPRAEKAGVRLEASGGSAMAAAPRETLTQALLNLALNAVAHTPPGGRVEIGAAEEPDGVTVRVRDQGPGVPDEERERIWEPFHSGGGGTGLGLAVVRRLARAEGWGLEVADAPAGGAEFLIRIPRLAAPAPLGSGERQAYEHSAFGLGTEEGR